VRDGRVSGVSNVSRVCILYRVRRVIRVIRHKGEWISSVSSVSRVSRYKGKCKGLLRHSPAAIMGPNIDSSIHLASRSLTMSFFMRVGFTYKVE
jgi:hypothetical protein